MRIIAEPAGDFRRFQGLSETLAVLSSRFLPRQARVCRDERHCAEGHSCQNTIVRIPLLRSPAPSDLLSLDAATSMPLQTGAGASSQDSILNAAEMFQAQLDQMTTWKHQLAQQMEVMRRDGIKLLERQKNLAIEKKRAGEEREVLASERTRIQKLQHDLDAETRRLTQRAADLESSHAELQKLRR